MANDLLVKLLCPRLVFAHGFAAFTFARTLLFCWPRRTIYRPERLNDFEPTIGPD